MDATTAHADTKRLPKGEGMLKRVHEMEKQVEKAAARANRFFQMAQSAEKRVKVKQEKLNTMKLQAESIVTKKVAEVVAPISATVAKGVQREINRAVKDIASKYHIDVKAAPVRVTKSGSVTIRVAGKPSTTPTRKSGSARRKAVAK